MNEAVLIVPRYWGGRRNTFGTTIRYFGKTYPAEREREQIENVFGLHFKGVPTVWVLDSHQFGRIGVCICYDLLDLCRLSMYRGRIHHLLVLAYNEDLLSFQHVAEAAMRSVYCNVVVCNTGKYGGSLAIAPLHDLNRRIIHQQMGAGLFDCQVFELSVEGLAARQGRGGRDLLWKSLPPGYRASADLRRKDTVIKSRVVVSRSSQKASTTKEP
jgi:predicted amidohydrolase